MMIFEKIVDQSAVSNHSIIELKSPFGYLFQSYSETQKDQLLLQIKALSSMKRQENFLETRNFTIGGLTDAFSIHIIVDLENSGESFYIIESQINSKMYILHLLLLCLDIKQEKLLILLNKYKISVTTDKSNKTNQQTKNKRMRSSQNNNNSSFIEDSAKRNKPSNDIKENIEDDIIIDIVNVSDDESESDENIIDFKKYDTYDRYLRGIANLNEMNDNMFRTQVKDNSCLTAELLAKY